MKRVVAHWTAGAGKASGLDRKHYHFIVENSGRVVSGKHPVKANLRCRKGGYAAHTRGCNTGSIGISMAGMRGATESPLTYGPSPISEIQFEAMCKKIASLCKRYKIPITRKTVLSHAEVQGTLGIKQRGKWDYTILPFNPKLKGARACGDYMRQRVTAHAGGSVIAVPAKPKPKKNDRWLSIQKRLCAHGFPVTCDGIRGNETVRAVKKFQKESGLAVDGAVGDFTWAALKANPAPPPPEPKKDLSDPAADIAPELEADEMRDIVEDAAATNRVSKEELGSVLLGGGAAVQTGRQVMETVNEASTTAGEAGDLLTQVVNLGPWVLLGVIMIGIAVFVWYRRRRRRNKSRKALK